MIQQAGILAAGLGTRLVQDRAAGKPMVEVRGKPLIHYVVAGLVEAGVRRVAMVLNSRGRDVEAYCRTAFPRVDWRIAYHDTAHSLETFRALQPLLERQRFILSMADAVLAPRALIAFVSEASVRSETITLAVTDWVDDEKPLWVRFDAKGRVTALGPEAAGSGWVTAGVYAVASEVCSWLGRSQVRSMHGLREFFAYSVRVGAAVRAIPVGQAVDVDRPADLVQAERLLERLKLP